ncbi:hypothetical protein BDB01DRAFT_458497 [Pilobolus umbonatus]|nr:hypothetical protein BDB01DRAFT_458497 [Pilobolus umbonatus]
MPNYNRAQTRPPTNSSDMSPYSQWMHIRDVHPIPPLFSSLMYHTDSETTIYSYTVVDYPKQVYMQNTADNQLSMTNVSLQIPPQMRSDSIIWIDEEYNEINSLKIRDINDMKKRRIITKRGLCNIVTMVFIVSAILCLFIYPFYDKLIVT